jgi:hypothetical protein
MDSKVQNFLNEKIQQKLEEYIDNNLDKVINQYVEKQVNDYISRQITDETIENALYKKSIKLKTKRQTKNQNPEIHGIENIVYMNSFGPYNHIKNNLHDDNQNDDDQNNEYINAMDEKLENNYGNEFRVEPFIMNNEQINQSDYINDKYVHNDTLIHNLPQYVKDGHEKFVKKQETKTLDNMSKRPNYKYKAKEIDHKQLKNAINQKQTIIQNKNKIGEHAIKQNEDHLDNMIENHRNYNNGVNCKLDKNNKFYFIEDYQCLSQPKRKFKQNDIENEIKRKHNNHEEMNKHISPQMAFEFEFHQNNDLLNKLKINEKNFKPKLSEDSKKEIRRKQELHETTKQEIKPEIIEFELNDESDEFNDFDSSSSEFEKIEKYHNINN